ncbi:glycosyl transferase, group 2 family protein [Proteiniborus sp. DW1]|uniref:glycosyltransferase family 4 protein n=1 Tax=Proteiniborus sp. DW1 TaxID=1889883 RepID=UPI00092E11ED|nr:glycosyltransferase family 4 protein [Proteiniborus sp. DW1]SCG83908.1 glycosyl transferase, group 2 family protein [Proteiniborus sp. DW1]
MNILLVAMGLDIGGAETHVVNLARKLKRKGHYPVVISSGGVYEQEIISEQIPHYKAELDKKGLKATINSLKIMRDVVKSENIDLIHAHGRIPAFISKIISIVTHTPFMTTAHAKFDDSIKYRLISFWGEVTISVSEDIKEHLIKNFGVKEDRITVINNGIDTERFNSNIDTSRLQQEVPISVESNKVVYISRLSGTLADVARMVSDAIYKIRKQGVLIDLIVVGDGDDFSRIENYSHKINSEYGEKFIHVLGKRTDIPEILAFGDVVVAVSRSALEAMSCEKAVVLVGGEGYMGLLTDENLSVAMQNNFTGRTVKEEITTDKIANEIEKIIGKDNAIRRAKLGKLGREVVKEYFSIDSMTDETIEIYKKLINRRK